MAIFARPAVWSYDLPLFRQAIAHELELEGLLAATVEKEEAVWVVEADEQPVAFAWGTRQAEGWRLRHFHVTPHPAAREIRDALWARIAEDS